VICQLYVAVTLCTLPTDIAAARIEVAHHTATTQRVFLAQTLVPQLQPQPRNKLKQKPIVAVLSVPRKLKKAPAVLKAYAAPEKVSKRGFFEKIFGLPKKLKTSQVAVRGEGYRAVDAAARKYGVDPAFMHRVARQESGGQCSQTSPANARGVLQVIPGTARIHGVTRASKLYDCKIGAETGVREMKRLLALTGGDKRKALIGYNCGPACIGRKKLPRETTNYIAAIGVH
jgi:soluble lytic murein transglycosylase-like protein